MRAELTAFGARRCPVSRNEENLAQMIMGELECRLGENIERDRESLELVRQIRLALEQKAAPLRPLKLQLMHPAGIRPSRLRKKDLATEMTPSAGMYANPFAENPDQRFGKYPDWLLTVPDKRLKPQEKLIYGRLLFPLPPICKNFRKDTGEIVGLNQGELARTLGMSRPTLNHWLIALQAKRWIECIGSPGSKQMTRFIYKEWMPETCRTFRQVGSGNLSASPAQRVGHGDKEPVGMSRSTCVAYPQVSEVIEKRESRRERRESSNSPFPTCPSRSRYDGPDW